MQRITAPYGFVPLSETVVHPEWVQPGQRGERLLAPPVHDLPFEDGICGELRFELVAETPLFSRGVGADPESPFTVGDRYALPATSLRGWLRNTVEIISFARMRRVNRRRYAVRDLHNRSLYGDHMAQIVRDQRTGKQEPMPLVNAGWLRRGPGGDDRSYVIEVCDFAKIEYALLEKAARAAGVASFHPGDKQSSKRKYLTWGPASREVAVDVWLQRPERVNGRVLPSAYGKVRSLDGRHRGTLVFTGQPTPYRPDPMGSRRRGNAKHHDFVFFRIEDEMRTLPVRDEVFRDFEFGHADTGQEQRLANAIRPNEEWGYWKPELDEPGGGVPVFFLTDDAGETVRAMGLAMMFRLACQYNPLQAVEHAQGRHDDDDGLDFAEGLFGTVRSPKRTAGGGSAGARLGALALKGRVDCDHGLGPSVSETRLEKRVEVVLGTPKASYYPSYVEQEPGRPGAPAPRNNASTPVYTTWQDDGCRPRGWKRYRILTRTWTPPEPRKADGGQASQEVKTRFRPLPAGTRFSCSIFVHNVRPAELGALLWALRLGGDSTARHSLGMARPLGYGRCRVERLQGQALQRCDGRAVELDGCQKDFVDYMDKQVEGWGRSPQIGELLALAQPVDPAEVQYLRLDPASRLNEYVEAKKDGLALPSVADPQLSPGRWYPPGSGRQAPAARPAATRPSGQPAATRPAPSAPSFSRPIQPFRPPAAARAWPGMRRGDELKVRLLELNKKGKWRSEAVEYEGARGTIEGTPAPDAAPGKIYVVRVLQGGDPRNLNLEWK